MRAFFPLSFGKQSKSPVHSASSSVHSATRRTFFEPPAGSSSFTKGGSGPSLPSLSSSSKTWLSSLRNPKPTRGRSGDAGHGVTGHAEEDEDGAMIGPPRPPPGEEGEEDDVMAGPPRPRPKREEEEEEAVIIGPPRPPPLQEDEEDDEVMIGPPRPPPQTSDMTDSDLEDDSDEEFEGSPDDSFRMPLSNEIVLKGHSKVRNIYSPWCTNLRSFLKILA